jgi:putative ABC transport system permease protein
MLQRPGRSALTALGTVLGVGTFVAILGLTATASSQIDSRFNALANTQVTIQDISHAQNEFATLAFPADADEVVEQLHGVEHAGVYWQVRLHQGDTVRSSPLQVASGTNPSVIAATPGVLIAAGVHLVQGRILNSWHDDSRQQVAVIGYGVASRLGITTLDLQPVVFIGEDPFTVVGIIDNVDRMAELLSSIVVPRSTALALWGPPADPGANMLISTRVGAAQQIAHEAPTALRPDHPEYFKTVAPPDPKTLRSNVASDLNQLFLLLAAISLVIGAVGIANTTLVAVMERTTEIGLRRSLGARGRHITSQFLSESATLGALGGLVGTSIGIITVVFVALGRHWTPVIAAGTLVAGPLIGLGIGVLAGIYPAWRAARIQPAEALRR